MLTVFLSLSAALGWGFHDFLIQPATRRVGAFAAMFWVLLVSTAMLMTTALIIDGPPGGEEWTAVGIAAAGGITYMLGVATLFHALEVGKLSIVTPLTALMGGVAAVASIALGERVGVWAAVALPLAVGGAVMASIVREEGEVSAAVDEADGDATSVPAAVADPPRGHLRTASGAGWALLGALLFGTTFLLYGCAGAISPVSAAGWGRLTGFLVFLPFALVKVDLAVPAAVFWRTVLCGLLDSGAYVAMTAATARGPLTIASALSAQFATVAVILGLVVRRERPSHIQRAGISCTIAAVVFFSIAV